MCSSHSSHSSQTSHTSPIFCNDNIDLKDLQSMLLHNYDEFLPLSIGETSKIEECEG
jgi:hypothetical protein